MKQVVLNWLLFIAIIAAFYCIYEYWDMIPWPKLPTMTGLQAVIFGFACAFMWVEVLKWWKNTRPFNCLKCMSGWLTVLLAFLFHVEYWPFYLPVGVAVGAVFSAIRMRWL